MDATNKVNTKKVDFGFHRKDRREMRKRNGEKEIEKSEASR